MRISRFLVFVALAMLASSALAQDRQPYNLDPETQNVSAMSENLRGQLVFVPAPSRHTVGPAGTDSIKAAIAVQAIGPINPSRTYSASFHELTPLPEGSTLAAYVTSPKGVREAIPGSSLTVPAEMAGNVWMGLLWYGSFPLEWGSGFAIFEVEIVVGGIKTVVTAQVSVMMNPVPILGPLEDAQPTPDGGVFLTGVFKSSPVVVAPHIANRLIPVEGDRFIPSSARLSWETVLVVCSESAPRMLECSTRTVYVPSRDSSPRNR